MNTEMLNDRTYPNSPGHKGHADTGRISAQRVAGKTALQRKQVLAALARPATHDEIAEMIRPPRMDDVEFETFKRGVRSRCSELKAQGKIQATSMRRNNDSGHTAVVWMLAAYMPVVSVGTTTALPVTTSSSWKDTAVQQELI